MSLRSARSSSNLPPSMQPEPQVEAAQPRKRVRRPPGGWASTLLIVLVGGLTAYYFFGGGRVWALRFYYGWLRAPQQPARLVTTCDRKQAQKVVDLVRTFRPGYSLQSLGDRLAIIGGWLKGHGMQMAPAQWQVTPIGLQDYYRVTYVLTGVGYQQRWRWRVNLRRGIAYPVNASAERLAVSDTQFERLFAEPKASQAVAARSPKPKPAAPAQSRPRVAPAGPPDVRLLGMMESTGALYVLLEIAGDDVEAQQGQRLSNGWVVRKAVRNPEGGGYVVLAKGQDSATLRLRSTTLLAVVKGGDASPAGAAASPPKKASPAEPEPADEGEDEVDEEPDAIGFPTVPPDQRVDREALGLPDLRSPKP